MSYLTDPTQVFNPGVEDAGRCALERAAAMKMRIPATREAGGGGHLPGHSGGVEREQRLLAMLQRGLLAKV